MLVKTMRPNSGHCMVEALQVTFAKMHPGTAARRAGDVCCRLRSVVSPKKFEQRAEVGSLLSLLVVFAGDEVGGGDDISCG